MASAISARRSAAVSRACARLAQLRLRGLGRRDACAAEDDDGGLDALFLLHQLGLEQFELHAHRAQFLAQQELGVGEGQPVGAFGAAARGAAGLVLRLGLRASAAPRAAWPRCLRLARCAEGVAPRAGMRQAHRQ
jgi:hypothetical protein